MMLLVAVKCPGLHSRGIVFLLAVLVDPIYSGKKALLKLAQQQYSTLFETLALLPDTLEIFPSHGQGSQCGKSIRNRNSSTLGYEKQFNPFLKKEPKEHWLHNLLDQLSPPPKYFKRNKQLNVKGPPLLNTLQTLVWNEQTHRPALEELFLFDIRLPEAFAQSHIEHSINIPNSHSFCEWAGWMFPEQLPLGLILESPQFPSEVVTHLRVMGFDQEIWIIQMGIESAQQYRLSSFKMIDPQELALFDGLLIDVRTTDEWRVGHVLNAQHIELKALEEESSRFPKDQKTALICKSGQRASLGASLLKKQGFTSVANVRGGMQAWKQSGLPILEETVI